MAVVRRLVVRIAARTTEARGVPMLVGHHRRHSPDIRAAKKSIAAGELGELVIDDETGVEYEVVSVDPPRLEAAPQEAEDWGE